MRPTYYVISKGSMQIKNPARIFLIQILSLSGDFADKSWINSEMPILHILVLSGMMYAAYFSNQNLSAKKLNLGRWLH